MIKYFFLLSILVHSSALHAQDNSTPTPSEEQLGLPDEEPLAEEEAPLADPLPSRLKPNTLDSGSPSASEDPIVEENVQIHKKRRRTKSASNESGTTSETSVSTKKRKSTLLQQVGPRFMLWQEKISGTESGAPVIYNARFSAFAASYSHKSSWGGSRRWLFAHEGDFIIGSVKASGTVNSTTDNLNSLIFFGVQLSPGITYRTANATLITFSTPVFFRKLSWDIGRTTLQLGDESAFDFGLGMSGSWRFNNGSFLITGVTARSKSVMWTLGWDFRFQ
jgi:hypothetical protein